MGTWASILNKCWTSFGKNSTSLVKMNISEQFSIERANFGPVTVMREIGSCGPRPGEGGDSGGSKNVGGVGQASGEFSVGRSHPDLYITFWNHDVSLKSNLS